MKHHTIKAAFTALFTIHCSIFTTSAQTLHVVQGNVTDQYTAAQTGDMTYTDNGSSYSISNESYNGTGSFYIQDGKLHWYNDQTGEETIFLRA